MPKFTVLIPTHDHADTLLWSVASVQAQTRQDFELFIVGDGVPDRTREIVAQLQQQDRRIRFFDNPKGPNRGELHRHRALQEATGELICYQTDDDLWLPDHLESLEGLLADNDLAHTMQIEIDPGQATPSTWFFNARLPAEVEALRQRQTGFGTAATGHTAAAYRALPFGWRTTPPGYATDQYMWLQFLDQPWCRAASLPRPTMIRFGSPARKSLTVARRAAELAEWSAKLASPHERLALIRAAMEPVCARTHTEKIIANQKTALLTAALELLHPNPPPRIVNTSPTEAQTPCYDPGSVLTFQQGGPGIPYLAYGFSDPEPWGVWSTEPSAAIVLPLAKSFTNEAHLLLDYTTFLVPERHEQMRVVLSVNGKVVDDWDAALPQNADTRIVPLPAPCLQDACHITIQFRLEHPQRPTDLGLSADSRLLGLGLVGLSLEPAA